MAHREPGTNELVALLSWGTAVAAVALAGLLAIAFVAELLRRRRRATRLVATLDRAVPIAVRAAVVSVVSLVTALVGARPAGGTDSVRGWLDGSPTTTIATAAPAPSTSTRAPSSSSTTTTTLARPTALAPPVVLEPPVTPADLDPPVTAPPAPSPVPATTPAPAPAPSRAGTRYVVVAGDCLWAIAERRLAPGADARSIDAGWRAIYATNRVAIGDDPNLIHPGLTLTLPPLQHQP
jgi:nucleoid-associated protein YgaU